MAGLGILLAEAWKRYRLPIAITECHLNCTREDQLRWLKETWDTCCQMKVSGVNITAVTAWSLLGAYDWNSLLIKHNNHYETGIYDVRSGMLRPTAIAKMICSLTAAGDYKHPLLQEKGWWNRRSLSIPVTEKIKKTSPVCILGNNRNAGKAFMKICSRRNIPCNGLLLTQSFDYSEADLRLFIKTNTPWAFIDVSGYSDEQNFVNGNDLASDSAQTKLLAALCFSSGIQMMTFSAGNYETENAGDMFPMMPLQNKTGEYTEKDQTIMNLNPEALVIQSSTVADSHDNVTTVNNQHYSLSQARQHMPAADAEHLYKLADAAMDLLIDGEKGIWQLPGKYILPCTGLINNIPNTNICSEKMLVA